MFPREIVSQSISVSFVSTFLKILRLDRRLGSGVKLKDIEKEKKKKKKEKEKIRKRQLRSR